MMTNHTHQVAVFDSIVEDETSRKILSSVNLQPSSWNLPNLEMERILQSGLRIKIEEDLCGINWPACADRKNDLVTISRDFLELESLTNAEKLATIIHEIGHIVNPEPAERPWIDKKKDERATEYLGAMNPDNAPAAITELYADDYARHSGFATELKAALHRLREDYPDLFETQTTRDRLDRIDSGFDPVLSRHVG